MIIRIFYTLFSLAMFSVYGQTTVTLLHTNNVNGTLENCLCADHPLGSIEKIKPIVDSIRYRDRNVLYIDTGDFFSAFGDQKKDMFVLNALKLMQYDLLIPGDQEFSNGIDFYRQNIFKQNLPYISSNVRIENLSDPVNYKIFKFDGIRILFISITHPNVFKFYDQSIIKSIKILDPVIRIKEILNKIESDYAILLSHSGLEQDISIAERFPEIGLIIGGHSQDVLKEALKVNKTHIVQAGSDGYYLGKTVLGFVGTKLESVTSRLMPLTLDLPNDPQLVRLAKKWDFQFISKFFQKEKQWLPLDKKYLATDAATCAECHSKQYKSWRAGPHALSWQSIVQKKKTKSLKCVSCHVSGFGRLDGFINENLTPEHLTINCTDCHRTDAQHLTHKTTTSVQAIDAIVCQRCHNAQNDPEFNFEIYKDRVVH